MTDKNNPDNELTPAHDRLKSASNIAAVDQARRRVAKSGLAASVLLTLASRPVLGADLTCQSPSGFQSGNVSQPGTPVACLGRTPGYWKTQQRWGKWPTPYDSSTCSGGASQCNDGAGWTGGTLFHPTFCGSKFNKPGTSTCYSMMQVLWLEGYNDQGKLGAHICAALLNAKMGWTPVLSEDAVKRIWYEYDTQGYYEPTSGVQWGAEQIVTYLKSTMTL